jgi:hypothetical protein
MSPQLLPKDTSPEGTLSMLAGLAKASGNDSEFGARKAALRQHSPGDETRPLGLTPT